MMLTRIFSLEQYHRDGFTGPTRVFTETEAAARRACFYETIEQTETDAHPTNVYLSAWHSQYRWAYDMAAHPQILDQVGQVLGDNIVMWAMHFWYKPPHSPKHIPWHQDAAYWQIEPKKNVTAWVALGATFLDNGCLRIIPGSHRQLVAHAELNDPDSTFSIGLSDASFDEAQAVNLEMQPGEAVIFNEGTYHGSKANQSDVPRLGFSVRYTSPEVKFLQEEWEDIGRIKLYLLRGEDRFHLNDNLYGKIPGE